MQAPSTVRKNNYYKSKQISENVYCVPEYVSMCVSRSV